MDSVPANRLEQALAACLADRKSRSQLRQLTTFPASIADFSSNSYLSLSHVPKVQQAYFRILDEQAASRNSIFGSGGSRLLDGNSHLAESLERDIAAFHRAPAGLLFNSGFDANVGLLSCLPQPGDIVVYDELVHASVHDGMKLSKAARRLPFRHNSVNAEDCITKIGATHSLKSLGEVLSGLNGGADSEKDKRNVFVVVEGVYSMDGDVAPLTDISACIKEYLPHSGYLIVDEAHTNGLFGSNGRGLVCELELEGAVFARLHTFGKAMGSAGAIVLCSEITRQYLINYARPLIYTTSLPVTTLANIKASYDYLASGQADSLRTQLVDLTAYARQLLVSVCSRRQVCPDLLRLDSADSQTPIIPVFTSKPRSLALYCQSRGFKIRPIVAPTVPLGTERVRVCLHAANTKAQIKGLCSTIEDWLVSQTQGQGSLLEKASL